MLLLSETWRVERKAQIAKMEITSPAAMTPPIGARRRRLLLLLVSLVLRVVFGAVCARLRWTKEAKIRRARYKSGARRVWRVWWECECIAWVDGDTALYRVLRPPKQVADYTGAVCSSWEK
jgi:hypothetical protein